MGERGAPPRRRADANRSPTPDPRDKRFADPEWSSNQYFDFLKQAYLVTADWAKHLVDDASQLDPTIRQKAEFYMRQLVNAASPSNFIFTNPELLRTTINENAENLVRGTQMLAEDIAAGGGELEDPPVRPVEIRGRPQPRDHARQGDLPERADAAHPIRAVDRRRCSRRPLLIVPPWINKFYVLDLTPEKSLHPLVRRPRAHRVRISWVNPDERLAAKGFADYMREGPLEALDVIAKVTGEAEVNAIGYCVGGTLLAITLAYMAAKTTAASPPPRSSPPRSTSPMRATSRCSPTTEEQIESVERQMAERGYLEGDKMATAFNLLRSNDLIWPYVVNNYLKGEAPFPFDLLYWNSDATRMPAANHSYYLRNCYLENNLTKGKTTIDGVAIDLGKVTMPIYNLATREDHIAPAKSVYLGSSSLRRPDALRAVRLRPYRRRGQPAQPRRSTSTGPATRPAGDDVDAWLATATEHPGSWWPDWLAWIKAQDATEVPARAPGGGVVQADRGCAGELRQGAELSGPRHSGARVFARTRNPDGLAVLTAALDSGFAQERAPE